MVLCIIMIIIVIIIIPQPVSSNSFSVVFFFTDREGDDKHSRKRERYIAGGSMEFREKEGYKPEVKLEYVDEAGRTMAPKEAFRYLSHRFHGKGSGKKKLEKRIKKAEEDHLMRSMSSTDTPLNTVHLLQEKQKVDKLPYIVLSGGKGIAAYVYSLCTR